jgi:hypothetical protein
LSARRDEHPKLIAEPDRKCFGPQMNADKAQFLSALICVHLRPMPLFDFGLPDHQTMPAFAKQNIVDMLYRNATRCLQADSHTLRRHARVSRVSFPDASVKG